MVTIKHKLTGKIETITISVWEQKYNHELWSIINFKDIVKMYQWINGKKNNGQIVEKTHALEKVAEYPNEYSFNVYSLRKYKADKELLYLNEIKEIISPKKIQPLVSNGDYLFEFLKFPEDLKEGNESVEVTIEEKKKTRWRKFLDFIGHADTKTVIQTTVWCISIITAVIAFFTWVLPFIMK